LPTVSFSAALAHAETLAQTETHRPKPSTFINASGLGASTLVPDDSMFPIRGQTVLVKGEAHSTITRVGQSLNGVVPDRTYAIPRPGSGTTILGGTKEEGVWDEHPDDVVTEGILKRARALVPELLTGEDEGFEVLSVQVGLRPGRRGGVRVEREVVSVGERKVRVVHAYGHAGSGYQNSVGGARDVCRLVQEGEGERVAKL
jgi:D-amino-acid oxidase